MSKIGSDVIGGKERFVYRYHPDIRKQLVGRIFYVEFKDKEGNWVVAKRRLTFAEANKLVSDISEGIDGRAYVINSLTEKVQSQQFEYPIPLSKRRKWYPIYGWLYPPKRAEFTIVGRHRTREWARTLSEENYREGEAKVRYR